MSDTLSLPEAAARLGISKAHAYRLAKRDGRLCEGIVVVRFGSVLRVSRAQVERVLGLERAS